MKTKILNFLAIAILSVIILPILITTSFAVVCPSGQKPSDFDPNVCVQTTDLPGRPSPDFSSPPPTCPLGTIPNPLSPGNCMADQDTMGSLPAGQNPTPIPPSGGSSPSSGSSNSTSIEIPNPLKVKSISALIDRIVTYIITIATILLPLAVLYAAYLFMSSGGDTEKITMGRKTLLWTVVGYALILISKGVTLIVADILGGKS